MDQKRPKILKSALRGKYGLVGQHGQADALRDKARQRQVRILRIGRWPMVDVGMRWVEGLEKSGMLFRRYVEDLRIFICIYIYIYVYIQSNMFFHRLSSIHSSICFSSHEDIFSAFSH